jgi:hypothetical protein
MTPHPNALPNHENAVIESNKLQDYLLNPEHPVGGNKARVFASALGFARENWADFEREIRRTLPQYPAHERPMRPFGREFTVDLPLSGPKGHAVVRTGWMIDNGFDLPRLTTAYVNR